MYLVTPDKELWENQYILGDLFKEYNNQIIRYQELRDLDKEINKISGCVFIFSSNFDKFKPVLKIVKQIKPKIIVHLSDEYGNRPRFQKLAKFCDLLLRQHRHVNYQNYQNIVYLPLGYADGMFESNYNQIEVKHNSEKKYNWSFIGNQKKKDRKIMINNFKKIPNYYLGKASATEMRDIYRESIFVPNGRGNVKLDCFRLYEASACGAIPIVVGNNQEIHETFQEMKNPPWIFCKTWEDAVYKCRKLLENKEKLNLQNKKVRDWWINIRDDIKNKIDISLK